ncbi:Hypothetical protein D9617_11g009140 [Elsinoe fawcettii]|nr:Hypothetical protein D9617_11g009140 [Elsinoe fawcettii]
MAANLSNGWDPRPRLASPEFDAEQQRRELHKAVMRPPVSQLYKIEDTLHERAFTMPVLGMRKFYSAIAGPFDCDNLPPFFTYLGDKEMGDVAVLAEKHMIPESFLWRFWPDNFNSQSGVLPTALPWGRPHLSINEDDELSFTTIGNRILLEKTTCCCKLNRIRTSPVDSVTLMVLKYHARSGWPSTCRWSAGR